MNQTYGLCGTFNYITRDDYQTPNGLIETNIIAFADAYKVSQTCTTPSQTTSCSLFPAVSKQNKVKNNIFLFLLLERIICSNNMSKFIKRSNIHSMCSCL
jgi:hypothetical protein